ncbi:MAG: ribosome maturation factor RimM [Burkholderiales bacterium]
MASSSKRPETPAGSPPENLVVMGRITAPFGIRGWIKLQAYTQAPENLLAYPTWWVGSGGDWQQSRLEQGQVQNAAVVAKLAGCEDRDAAALYRGKQVAIPRDAFPQPAANEFYWSDLVGLRVVNAQGEDLGKVKEVLGTGANDVLVVQGERERLIPFTEITVTQVDVPGGMIRVDWEADF